MCMFYLQVINPPKTLFTSFFPFKTNFLHLDGIPSKSTCFCFLNISSNTTQSGLHCNTKTTKIPWRKSLSNAINGIKDRQVINQRITYQVMLWFRLHPLLDWYTATQIHWWKKLTIHSLHFCRLLVERYSGFQLKHCHLLIQVLELQVGLQSPPSKLNTLTDTSAYPQASILPLYNLRLLENGLFFIQCCLLQVSSWAQY